MTQEHIYGTVNSKTDLHEVFLAIRKDVDTAASRPDLTELYKRAGYLITLSYAPSWEEKFGDDAKTLRDLAREEFSRTARKINSKAAAIGTEADYKEQWGGES